MVGRKNRLKVFMIASISMGELPNGNGNTSKGYDLGAQLTEKIRQQSKVNSSSSHMKFATPMRV
jgi:hypothetical protein